MFCLPSQHLFTFFVYILEFREETEDAFFSAITMNLDSNGVSFKLAPTYTIYMATRFRASTHYRTELIPEERAVRLTEMLNNVAECIFATVETGQRDPSNLAFWMANASELLHFLKSDRHIHAFRYFIIFAIYINMFLEYLPS